MPGSRPSILSQYDQDKKAAPKFSIGMSAEQLVMIRMDKIKFGLKEKLGEKRDHDTTSN